ncbi:hypothetical protein K443DRAFT_103489, partial [Laccaria amethystina LaAM-08-1]
TVFPDGRTISSNYAKSSRGQAQTSPAHSTQSNVITVEGALHPVFASPEQRGWPTNPLLLSGVQWP